MSEVKPISIQYVQTDMFDTGLGNIYAKFTPVGGPVQIVNTTYADLSAGDKIIYDNFITMLKAQ